MNLSSTLVYSALASLTFLAATGCSSGSDDDTPTPDVSPTPTVAPGISVDVDDLIQSGDTFQAPLDSVPGPAIAESTARVLASAPAANVYFVATGSNGQGIFSVPATGGAAKELYTGQPFSTPTGIALSSDYRTLYVADASSSGANVGAIIAFDILTQTPTVLAASVGTMPRSLTVLGGSKGDVIYYSGVNPLDMKPAVLSIAVVNGKPAVIAKGTPLVYPDGIAVTAAGTIYVADRQAAGAELGKVFKIAGGKVTAIVEAVKTGTPAGAALTQDDSTLLVSSINTTTGTDQVLLVNLSTLTTSVFSDTIGANTSGGGVHAMPGSNTFAWSDKTAGGPGKVYAITLN